MNLAHRVLKDGRALWVYPLTFGRARIVIGQEGSPFIDDSW